MRSQVGSSLSYFPLFDKGKPIANGYIYVGEPDTDPEVVVNQKSVLALQEDGSLVAIPQPIRTGAGGVPTYNGSPVVLSVEGDYSLKVLDSTLTQIYYFDSSDFVQNEVATVQDIRDIDITSLSSGSNVQALGYYAAGDGNQGPRRFLATGAAPGFYVDNGGSILVPTGGDGSAAWLWAWNGPVEVGWFGGGPSRSNTENTTAINAALGAVSDGEAIILPVGTCTFEINGSAPTFATTGKSVSVKGYGIGVSVLKVQDSAPNYDYIFNHQTGTVIHFSDFTIDENLPNNPVSAGSMLFAGKPRIAVGIDNTFSYAMFERVEVTRTHSVNNIVSASDKTTIKDCLFTEVGIGSAFAHDYSAIYTNSEESIIIDNRFEGYEFSGGNTGTAIEIHGGLTTVKGNIISNFAKAMNFTGIFLEDTVDSVVSGNVINLVKQGIEIWSSQYLTHTTGYGIDGLIVDSNTITVKESGLADHFVLAGIYMNPVANLPYRNIKITNNTIKYDLTTASTSPSQLYFKSGINLFTANVEGENIEIKDNVIDGAYGAGVLFLDFSGKNIEVVNNTAVNCGQGATTTYHAGVYANFDDVENVLIKDNNVFDDQAAATFVRGILAQPFDAGSAWTAVRIIDNNISWTGTNPTYEYFISGANVRPLIKASVVDYSLVYQVSANRKAGSIIEDRTNNIIRKTLADGNTFWVEGWGTGSPEGVLAAVVSSVFHRTDGGALTSLYIKESGTGNTGWVGK